ncbi:Gfo/Idh/MocA family oxidoreductase [Paenibacillus sp. MWE-103]|uniref:Gfo/Idh/MocA family oxidoreductase n=1 Tax=Paenibacillus artemisiicola TaxID=1172618 RepID=A0ABS3WGA5_9BACL|nr:Gfo/Idh/MocA family oxidoreductase [Paenibacillus artemisiicola]MBO7747330.1 Gfo/Idh/MocA family oxidoreductase [Paenibacillus artemisiicola]
MQKTKIGVIGCGVISGIYLENCTKTFGNLEVAAVADLVPEMARKRAEEYGIPKACTVQELLDDPEIEIVVNLTAPQVHADVNLQILNAGKHAYTEKPFAMNREDADRVLALAEEKGLRVGCAPDTFLGAGLQTSRKVIDDGWIGTPYAASGLILMGNAYDGMHPNFHNYLQFGWDPLFDMTPYYLTAFIHLLGPARGVSGSVGQVKPEHTVTNPRSPRFGETVPIGAPMHASALIDFESGVTATLQAAKESFGYTPRLEIYGTEGILIVPDPNAFNGAVTIQQRNGETHAFPYSHGFAENSRGIGIADMAYAIRTGRPHRASGALASDVLDLQLAILASSKEGRRVQVEPRSERPAALPLHLKYGLLD